MFDFHFVENNLLLLTPPFCSKSYKHGSISLMGCEFDFEETKVGQTKFKVELAFFFFFSSLWFDLFFVFCICRSDCNLVRINGKLVF